MFALTQKVEKEATQSQRRKRVLLIIKPTTQTNKGKLSRLESMPHPTVLSIQIG
jgi:hypothetical protein